MSMFALNAKRPVRIPIRLFKVLQISVHGVALIWLGLFYYAALQGNLSGDPVQAVLDFTGIGAFNLLLLSLVISPIATHFKFAQALKLRRPLGVYSAIYACAHLLSFIAFELQFEWALVAQEILERPYITVGFVALLILVSLMLTSFTAVKRAMGKSWQRLHNWVYLAALLVSLHFLWSVKLAWYEPAIYMALVFVLLFSRKQKLLSFKKKA